MQEWGITDKDIEELFKNTESQKYNISNNEPNPQTCVRCRWCKIVWYHPDIPCADAFCKRHIVKIDRVTGDVTYEYCKNVTNCSNWEQGGIKGFIQRMFNRKDKEKKK